VKYEHWETVTLPGYTEKLLSVVDMKRKSWAMNWWTYLFVSLVLQCSTVYRMWLDRNSIKAHYQYSKLVYVHP
jgi:hypothetical protein